MTAGALAASSVGAAGFRELFRSHAGGVVVVTLDGGAGPVGFTATSFTSLSLDPPLAVFGIARTASCWPHVLGATSLVVNILTASEQAIAERFATSGIDRFAPPVRCSRLSTGEPVLDGNGPWLRGTVVDRLPAGDHHLVVLHVESAAPAGRRRSALVHHDGAYH